MPTYEYLCQECGERLEVFQKFSDKPLKKHRDCGGALQKVFHPSGVVFKGSGYYITESRSNGSKTATDSKPEKAAKTDKPEAKSSEAKSKDSKKSDSKKSEKKSAAKAG